MAIIQFSNLDGIKSELIPASTYTAAAEIARAIIIRKYIVTAYDDNRNYIARNTCKTISPYAYVAYNLEIVKYIEYHGNIMHERKSRGVLDWACLPPIPIPLLEKEL